MWALWGDSRGHEMIGPILHVRSLLAAAFGRRARAITRITLIMATGAMSWSLVAIDNGHHGAWGVIATVGLVVAFLSFPAQAYALYTRVAQHRHGDSEGRSRG